MSLLGGLGGTPLEFRGWGLLDEVEDKVLGVDDEEVELTVCMGPPGGPWGGRNSDVRSGFLSSGVFNNSQMSSLLFFSLSSSSLFSS